MEHNRARHSEIGEAPTERFLRGPDIGRPSPTLEDVRLAFRVEDWRVQRRSDGTVTIAVVAAARVQRRPRLHPGWNTVSAQRCARIRQRLPAMLLRFT